MDKVKAIAQYIEDYWGDEEIIRAWNNYCSDECMDDYVYRNDEYFFDEQFEKADEAVRAVCYGEYKYMDDYVVFNGYGNLDSFCCWNDGVSPIDLDILAEYLIDNGDAGCERKIDNEDMIEYFVTDYTEEFGGDTSAVEETINSYLEEEDFDFLTEDWEDLAEIIKERLD